MVRNGIVRKKSGKARRGQTNRKSVKQIKEAITAKGYISSKQTLTGAGRYTTPHTPLKNQSFYKQGESRRDFCVIYLFIYYKNVVLVAEVSFDSLQKRKTYVGDTVPEITDHALRSVDLS